VIGGTGYQARASTGNVDRLEAGATARMSFGDVSADFSSVDSEDAVRVSARGGVAAVEGAWIPAPTIGGGVVVVSVGREPGVRVYHDRQLVGVTDSEGKVIVPGLRSFERNAISFETEDLPLSVGFDQSELIVTPGYRTGHKVAFNVTRPVSLIARIINAEGQPLPAGASLINADTGETYPIGSDGAVFIPDAAAIVHLSFRAAFARCDAVVAAPGGRPETPIWDAGQVVCHASTIVALQ
jgi:outer membrane usher protein